MALERGTLFDPQLVGDLINKVKGHSSLAKLAPQIPVAFNGNKEFTFSMDKEVDVVAESGAKSHGGVTVAPVTIVPIKIEYGARVSDEFMYATEEEKINILKAFNEGFAKKAARGLDLMALHGVNPRTGLASTVIGDNNFDTAVTQTVPYSSANPTPDDNIEAAVAQVQAAGYEVNGLIMAPAFASSLAAETVNGVKKYPELAWGANPETINGVRTDINKTVSDMSGERGLAYVGDFANAFKWGYAKEIPLEVIEYGNPDNDAEAGDLKGHNQVYLRCELYLGWGILDGAAFSRIIAEEPADPLTLTVAKGSTAGTTQITVTEALGAGNKYLIKTNGTVPRKGVIVEDGVDGWRDYTEGADIVAHVGEKIAIVESEAATGAVVKGAVTKTLKANDIKSN
jgi:hypothetical protein